MTGPSRDKRRNPTRRLCRTRQRSPRPGCRPSPSSTAQAAGSSRWKFRSPLDSRTNMPGEQRLLDTSRHGAIPRIGADGARPAEAYARATNLAAAGNSDNPRIAIVVGGLGISVTNTNDALAKLPGPITLAFSPYGTDIERHGRPRARGRPRGAAASSDGAVRLSRQRPRATDAFDHAARPIRTSTGCTG